MNRQTGEDVHPAEDPGADPGEHRAQARAEDPDSAPMALAIDASRAALRAGDEPYGAALVSARGELLHVAANHQKTRHDVTAHAEVELVREVVDKFGQAALLGGTVYASGEPCAMCSGALYWSGVGRIVFAAASDVMHRISGGDQLPIRCAQVLAGSARPVQVDGPVLADAAVAVLREAVAGRGTRSPADRPAP